MQTCILSLPQSRLKSRSGFEKLTDENGHAPTSDSEKDKAEAFARVFQEHYSEESGTVIMLPNNDSFGTFPAIADSVWFHATKIYTLPPNGQSRGQ